MELDCFYLACLKYAKSLEQHSASEETSWFQQWVGGIAKNS